MDEHEQSIDRIVQEWRSFTQQYADIFQSLVDATAAHPSSRLPGRPAYADLVEIARTANLAKTTASSFVLYQDRRKENARPVEAKRERDCKEVGNGDDSSLSQSEESEQSSEEHSQSGEPRFKRVKRSGEQLSDKFKDAMRDKISRARGAKKPNFLSDTLASSEKEAWKADTKRQRREKKQATRSARSAKADVPVENASDLVFERDHVNVNHLSEPEPVSASAATRNVVPKVEYEDVSAEVEARLKLKEEKKAAAKKEKKRKRESGGSIVGPDLDVRAEKPKTKKFKAVEDPAMNGSGSEKHERDEVDYMNGKSKKKRKLVNDSL